MYLNLFMYVRCSIFVSDINKEFMDKNMCVYCVLHILCIGYLEQFKNGATTFWLSGEVVPGMSQLPSGFGRPHSLSNAVKPN